VLSEFKAPLSEVETEIIRVNYFPLVYKYNCYVNSYKCTEVESNS